jgi:molybdopterin-guanine dinucleotide biosynthesis protein A
MRTLGVLVAGGQGARLGLGIPKALVRLGGRTLLERALATLAALCDEIALAAPAGIAAAVPAGVQARRVDDAAGASGPLAGMVAGLTAARFERALVLGVDFPFAGPATLGSLLDRLEAAAGPAAGPSAPDAVVPAPRGIAQPLAAAYAPAASGILAARLAAGERAPRAAIAALSVRTLDDRALAALPGGADAFFNLNTPADLEAARRRIESGPVA